MNITSKWRMPSIENDVAAILSQARIPRMEFSETTVVRLMSRCGNVWDNAGSYNLLIKRTKCDARHMKSGADYLRSLSDVCQGNVLLAGFTFIVVAVALALPGLVVLAFDLGNKARPDTSRHARPSANPDLNCYERATRS